MSWFLRVLIIAAHFGIILMGEKLIDLKIEEIFILIYENTKNFFQFKRHVLKYL